MQIDSYDDILKWSYNLASTWIKENLVPKGINSVRKFNAYKKEGGYLPLHFPRRPDDYFRSKGIWKGWRDFFGNSEHNRRKFYHSYVEACNIVRRHNIKNSSAYKQWKNRPANLPSRPEYYYAEWKGWEAFLGDSYKKPNPRRFSKLTENEVRIIKHQLSMGVSGAVLARSFGVSEMQICRIRKGENWSELG